MSFAKDELERISTEEEEEETPMLASLYRRRSDDETSDYLEEYQDIERYYLKECCRVKKATEDSEICGCGQLISDHNMEIAMEAEIGEWISEFDTIKKPSVPRKLLFRLNETDGNRATPATYLRIADDTTAASAVSLYQELYSYGYQPDILLSFLGGCGNEFVSSDTEESLKEGLLQLISSYDCLFFTRASHIGLAKLVARTCKSHTKRWRTGYVNQCVGFMPWGCVAGRRCLVSCEGDDDEFVRYDSHLSHEGETCAKSNVLDNNHQVFYLVDDGTINKYGAEIDLRSRMQNYLVVEERMPSINLLVGGGITSMQIVHAALFPDYEDARKNIVIPAVVLKNSGKIADVLASVIESDPVMEMWKDRKVKRYRRVNLMLATKCAAIKHLELDLTKVKNLKALSMLRECVEHKKDKIVICDVKKKNDNLYHAILSAALQGNTPALECYQKLKLAVELRDVGLARQLIQASDEAGMSLMFDALVRCNVRVVKDLLDTYNFNVELFVESHLRDPYSDIYEGGNPYKDAHGGRFVIDKVSKQNPWNFYLDETDLLIGMGDSVSWSDFMNNTLQMFTDENFADVFFLKTDIYDKKLINATQALMINCMMINHPPLTRIFWRYDKYNPLSNALLAFKMQSAIADLYEATVPRHLQANIEYFREKIVQLLTCYYESDEEMAAKVLSRKIPIWKNQTLIDVAGDLELKFFIEQPASQIVLSKEWNGEDPERQRFLEDIRLRTQKRNVAGLYYLFCYVINKYLGKPTTKFILHVLMYVISVGIFSFYMLVKKSPAHQTIKWIMFVMVTAVALDEFRQVVDHQKNLGLNIKRWASSPWNILDLSCILLFYTGFIASFFDAKFSKDVLAVFLCLWCIKLTQFLRTSSTLGPYMVMIFQMLAHIQTFLVVLFIAIIGYGVFMTAMLYPNSKASWATLFKVLFRPYLLVFGEMGLETHDLSSTKTVFGTPRVSRFVEILVIFGMAVFLMLANVLLLNLLIAAFSNIYEEVKTRSYQIWRFEEYELLQEFKNKPVLPFPYSIPESILLLFKCHPLKEQHHSEDDKIGEIEEREIADFQRSCMMRLWPDLSTEDEIQLQQKEDVVMTQLEISNRDMIERIESIAKAASDQKEQLRKRIEGVSEKVADRLDKSDHNTEQRLARLDKSDHNIEQRLARLDKSDQNIEQRLLARLDKSDQNIEQRLLARLDKSDHNIEQRLARLDKSDQNIEQRLLARLDKSDHNIEQRLARLDKSDQNIEQRLLARLDKSDHNIEQRLARLEEMIMKLHTRLESEKKS